jgi:ABC-type molybdenum transport system ATPase subunit/photorepair protein PhrA
LGVDSSEFKKVTDLRWIVIARYLWILTQKRHICVPLNKSPPMADEKIIFSMTGVNKIYPPQKQVLKNIYLSFFYGAKIGVLGLNGSGKSSLLRIIAGIDKEFQGEVVSDLGYSVGYLEQEPSSIKAKQ